MNQDSYIYNNAKNIRTTLEAVQYMNITFPPILNARGAIALLNCESTCRSGLAKRPEAIWTCYKNGCQNKSRTS